MKTLDLLNPIDLNLHESSSMKLGKVIANFSDTCGLYIAKDDLKTILNTMHHVDSYKKSEDIWRVQGWCYLSELPNTIPDELCESVKELQIRDGNPILEIWSMLITNNYPF